MHFAAFLPLLAVTASALPASNASDYFTDISQALVNANLTRLGNVIRVVQSSGERGSAIVNALFSEGNFTVYAPPDSAFEAAGLSNPDPSDQLVSLLAYHIVPDALNSSDVSPPRQHTVAKTLLRTETTRLPNNQSQVIVLEEAPAANGEEPGSRILVRGDAWNASSIGGMVAVSNLLVQPIDKILAVPSPLVKTLDAPLVLDAPNGFSALKALLQTFDAGEALEGFNGLTAFIPIDAAVHAEEGRLAGLSPAEAGAVLYNHFINGSVFYSQVLTETDNLVSSSGQNLQVVSNDTGVYVISINATAKILRTDVPIANGVVHVIDAVLFNTNTNEEAALGAASSAAAAATVIPTSTQAIITNTNTARPETSAPSASSLAEPSGAASKIASVQGGALGLSLTAALVGFLLIL